MLHLKSRVIRLFVFLYQVKKMEILVVFKYSNARTFHYSLDIVT